MTINQDGPVATATSQPATDTAPPFPTGATTSSSGTPKPAEGETWQEIGARKRAALLASMPREWVVPPDRLPPASQDDVTGWPAASGWFTPDELAITDLSATELVARLAAGALTSVDVTRAFCKRAVAAHQLVLSMPSIRSLYGIL